MRSVAWSRGRRTTPKASYSHGFKKYIELHGLDTELSGHVSGAKPTTPSKHVASTVERDSLVRAGCRAEGVGWYAVKAK
ncbi:hypothetical protein BTHE_1467 [Bifidobacterium thermophilum]|nr:hypothetical protein BTHE_1467 [Bifidobacterium thermophilum]